MFAGLDCRSQMLRSETGGGGQQNHVHTAIDHLLVGVQAHKARIFADLDARPELFVGFKVLETALQAIVKSVAHCCQHNAFTG